MLPLGAAAVRALPLMQHMHPTLVVAEVGTIWRTSVHKRSLVFHRWAPAPSTCGPEGVSSQLLSRSGQETPSGSKGVRENLHGEAALDEIQRRDVARADRRREGRRPWEVGESGLMGKVPEH